MTSIIKTRTEKKILCYIQKKGNISPCGTFAVRACNEYFCLYSVRAVSKKNYIDKEIIDFCFSAEKINIDKIEKDIFRGKVLYNDYFEIDKKYMYSIV